MPPQRASHAARRAEPAAGRPPQKKSKKKSKKDAEALEIEQLEYDPTEGAAPTGKGKANGKWGDDTHPSDNKLGYSDKFTKAIKPSGFHTDANHNFQNLSPDEVYQDDLENFGHGPTQEAGPGVATPTQVYDNYIVITPQPKVVQERVVDQASTDNLIGYSKCEIIGSCDASRPTELGRPCNSNSGERGFCNYDSEGDYLCMRTALWWSYGAQYGYDGNHTVNVAANKSYAEACKVCYHPRRQVEGGAPARAPAKAAEPAATAGAIDLTDDGEAERERQRQARRERRRQKALDAAAAQDAALAERLRQDEGGGAAAGAGGLSERRKRRRSLSRCVRGGMGSRPRASGAGSCSKTYPENYSSHSEVSHEIQF